MNSWPAVRAAIPLVSPVACWHCGPIEVAPDDGLERPRICHPFGDCPLYLFPDGDEAAEFAESVDVELGRHLVLGIYCDDLPVHVWEVV